MNRAFPSVEWCWPEDARALLVQAALLPDEKAARAALDLWLSRYDLDAMGFAEHRLLAAISHRFAKKIADPAISGRLQGLQRQIWTQSRLRVHHVLPMLQNLKAQGVELMLLKGAARIALHPEVQRYRAHQDVDILVRDEQMQRAAQLLAAEGWQSARGDSALAAIARAPRARAINFQKLPWGDIDLHRAPYHGRAADHACDQDFWTRASPAQYFGLPVLVPEAAERLALALSHGAWSPEAHSDWLIDAADIVTRDQVDWAQFMKIVTRRKLAGQIRIGLSYLQETMALDLPEEVETLLKARSSWLTLLIAKDEAQLAKPLKTLRKVSYALLRHERGGKAKAGSPLKLILARPAPRSETPQDLALSHPLPEARPDGAGAYTLDLTLVFKTPSHARRIEFELNSAEANLARFRVYARPAPSPYMRAKLRVRLNLTGDRNQLSLVAMPNKLLPPHAGAEVKARHAALPFALELAQSKA